MKYITALAALALVVSLGCQSTPKRQAYITISATVEVVQNTVRLYGAMVETAEGEKKEELKAAMPTVKAAFDTFRHAAMMAALAAENGFNAETPPDVSELATAVIQLVEALR